MDPRRAFQKQASNAKARGIPWRFTFEEWWGIWEPHFSKRGRHSDDLVMARFGDQGAYEVGNVEIKTARANVREARGYAEGEIAEGQRTFSAARYRVGATSPRLQTLDFEDEETGAPKSLLTSWERWF